MFVELTTFQFASTALTVTLNGVPAVCAVGVPVLPVVVPGAAASPGTSSCSFANPPLTAIAALMLAVLVPSSMSVAVTVRLPRVLKATLNVLVPDASTAFAGSVAAGSLEVIPTRSFEPTAFHCASTALTVTSKAVPRDWGEGVPVLPVVVPGAAVSPGTSTWSLANAPALTVNAALACVTDPLRLHVATSTYPAPALSIRQPLKVQIPVEASKFGATQPTRVPDGEPAPSASETAPPEPGVLSVNCG